MQKIPLQAVRLIVTVSSVEALCIQCTCQWPSVPDALMS